MRVCGGRIGHRRPCAHTQRTCIDAVSSNRLENAEQASASPRFSSRARSHPVFDLPLSFPSLSPCPRPPARSTVTCCARWPNCPSEWQIKGGRKASDQPLLTSNDSHAPLLPHTGTPNPTTATTCASRLPRTTTRPTWTASPRSRTARAPTCGGCLTSIRLRLHPLLPPRPPHRHYDSHHDAQHE